MGLGKIKAFIIPLRPQIFITMGVISELIGSTSTVGSVCIYMNENRFEDRLGTGGRCTGGSDTLNRVSIVNNILRIYLFS